MCTPLADMEQFAYLTGCSTAAGSEVLLPHYHRNHQAVPAVRFTAAPYGSRWHSVR